MKYIATVETSKGIERPCTISGGGYSASYITSNLEEIQAWVEREQGEFPFAKYHIYKLEEVKK